MNVLKKVAVIVIVSIFVGFFANAKSVSKLYFTGVTKSERISITITDKEQKMQYSTPSRDINYNILDYDVQIDTNNNSKILTATVVDMIYNTAYEIMLYSNESFSDIRIGKKRITFNYIQDFRIQ